MPIRFQKTFEPTSLLKALVLIVLPHTFEIVWLRLMGDVVSQMMALLLPVHIFWGRRRRFRFGPLLKLTLEVQYVLT